MRMRRVIAPLASIMVFCTACESAPEAAPVILMDPVATSEAPLTGINSIALADETTTCVIEPTKSASTAWAGMGRKWAPSDDPARVQANSVV